MTERDIANGKWKTEKLEGVNHQHAFFACCHSKRKSTTRTITSRQNKSGCRKFCDNHFHHVTEMKTVRAISPLS